MSGCTIQGEPVDFSCAWRVEHGSQMGKTWEPDGKAELKSMKTDAIFASEKLIAATASRLRFWVRL